MSNLQTIELQERSLSLEVNKFELEQRRSTALSKSAFFPNELKGDVASAVIVYDLAQRMDISVLEVAQSIYIIYNKPSFSTTFLVARLNQSGLIKGALRVIISQDKQSAYCVAIDAESGEEHTGMTVTMAMAKAEGWLSKKGSKWQTMPELMLRKRCQSFFIKEFYPQVMFGMQSVEEVEDIIDTKALPARAPQDDQDLNKTFSLPKTKPQSQPKEEDALDAEIEEASTRHEQEEALGFSVEPEPAPKPPKRSRRTKAEIEELLLEINSHSEVQYTKLGEVSASVGREATERLQFKREVKEALLAANEARAKGTKPFATLDQVDALNPMEKKHHVTRVKFINRLKAETPQETGERHRTMTDQAAAQHHANDDMPDGDNLKPENEPQEDTRTDFMRFGRVDIDAGITQKISDKFEFLVSQGLPAADFQHFIQFAGIDDNSVDYIEEDIGWIIGLIADWERQTGQG